MFVVLVFLFGLWSVRPALFHTAGLQRTSNQQQPQTTGNQKKPKEPSKEPPKGPINPKDSGGAQVNPGNEVGVANSTSSQTSVIYTIPAGTEILVVLDTPLSTKTSKPGDRFIATITQPVQGSNSNVVIPVGFRVEGEVSEAEQGKTLPALRGKGKLNLRFRDLVLSNGQTIPFTGTLVSVNSTNGKNSKNADNEGQIESGTRSKDVAKDVGIGAGIGTVTGLIFGGPLKGLAIGALAGGGYVLAANGKDVNLPAGTGMVIRLDEPLKLN